MKKNHNRILIGGLTLLFLLSAACGDRADRTYRQGLRLARQKKYDQAVGEMRRLLQMEPESVRARNVLGQIYRAQNLYTRAIEELTLAVEISRDDPVPAYNLGGVYWDLEDMEQAGRYYRLSLEIDPEFAPALYRMGTVSSRIGNPATAEEYFRAFLRAGPEDPAPGHNNLGVLLWRKGDRAEAFREFERARGIGSRHPEILYNFGVGSLLLDQQTRRGVEALLDYFRARPDGREKMELKRLIEKSNLVSATEFGLFTRDDYIRQGGSYEAAGQYRPAEKEYRQALELDPASGDAHYRLGRLYDRFLDDKAKAVSHYELFLKHRPRSSSAGEVIARLGALRPSLSDAPRSEPAAARSSSPRLPPSPPPADTAPPDPEEYCLQAERLAKEGAFDRAAAAYRECLESDPGHSPALLGLGNALLAAGDYPAAEAALLRAREINPSAPVRQALGRVYILLGAGSLASGRFEESIEYYQKAREEGLSAEADEGLWKAHHNYFRLLRERGDYLEAAKRLEKCLELRPEVEEDYIVLAELYGEELDRPDRSRFYFRKYLKLFPRGKQAERARESLRPTPAPPSSIPSPPPAAPPQELSAVEHYNRGTVYQREGRYAAAREEYLKALRRQPEFYQAFYNLGLVYYQEGRADQALAAFKEAARLNPDFPPAQLSLFNLYYYHYRMKNLARPHALRYIELAPDTPQARELRRGLGI
jgi:tetratricopeptide (TPR) repeat protein